MTPALDPLAAQLLLRAYARATLASAADAERTRRATTLLVHLQTDPAVAAMMQADAERWRERLLADGLDPLVATLAIAAAPAAAGSTCRWSAWGSGRTSGRTGRWRCSAPSSAAPSTSA